MIPVWTLFKTAEKVSDSAEKNLLFSKFIFKILTEYFLSSKQLFQSPLVTKDIKSMILHVGYQQLATSAPYKEIFHSYCWIILALHIL